MSLFDSMAEVIEQRTGLNNLVSRGCLRKGLKRAGLDAASVTPDQLGVVMERVMPDVLKRQGIDESDEVCADLATSARQLSGAGSAESAESVFRRLTST